MRQRLARLAPEIVDLLRIAAIVGRSFDAALLAEEVLIVLIAGLPKHDKICSGVVVIS